MGNKDRGGSRTLKNGSAEFRRRENEVIAMRQSGLYSSVIMTDKGGYVATEKSTMMHKPEELEAAQILADKGYKVILKDENVTEGKTPDGYVFSLSYEQKTPQGTSISNCVKALEHAKKKGASVAIIYDKYHNYHRSTIKNGLREYERLNEYRFERVIVISHDGRIHRHKHN